MSSILTGKPQLNRIVNRRLILDMIRRQGRVSRAELAKQTAIRPPTVSAVVKELIDERLVKEVGTGATTGGRAPRMVALNDRRPLALGFELSETSVHAGLCSLTGELTAKHRVATTPQSPAAAVEELYKIGDQLLKEASLQWDELEGIGVAVPGTLSQVEGLIRWSRPFGWRDVPFKQMCEERWSIETDVVNDSLAGGMAAHQFEIESPVENLVFLYLRFQDIKLDVVGIGVGLIINGQPYYGEFGAAGEIMTPVAHPLAHLASDGHVFASAEEFAESVETGQPESLLAMKKVAAELAPLVRHTINLLEPGVLLLGSDMPSLRDKLISSLREDLNEHHLDFEQGRTELRTSALGDFGVVRGATVPALQRLFRMPQWT